MNKSNEKLCQDCQNVFRSLKVSEANLKSRLVDICFQSKGNDHKKERKK
jgi:hypothetical protein